MATWPEVVKLIARLPVEQLGETMWKVDVSDADGAHTNDVYVSHELMPPDFEFVRVQCQLTTLALVGSSWGRFFAAAGNLQIGTIGFTPMLDDDGEFLDGALDIGTTIPLGPLELAEESRATRFLLYLYILAGAAKGIRGRLGLS